MMYFLVACCLVLGVFSGCLLWDRHKKRIVLEEAYFRIALQRYTPLENPDIVLRADDQGVIDFINDDISKIGGKTVHSLLGKKIDMLNNRLDDGGSIVMWDTIKNKRASFGFEIAGMYKTDTPFSHVLTIVPVMDMQDDVVGYLGLHVKEAELEQQPEKQQSTNDFARSQAHADAILSSIADGVLVTDRHGDIVMMNKACHEMLGLGESIGTSVIELLPLEDDNGALILPEYHPIYQAIKNPKPTSTKKFTYVRADFTKIWLAITTSPIVFDENVEGVVAVLRDATLEQQIDRSKTEFVSLASHQLRTPLTAINWYTELLLDQGTDKMTEDQVSFVNQIRESSGRMNELVSSLLNVSRLELGTFSVDPVPTVIADIVQSVLAELQPKVHEYQHTMNVEIEEDLEQVPVDQNLMRIVVQNLLSNAVKYTRPNGIVTVRLYRHYPDMRFEVRDNGYGIPKDQHAQIFTKLFRADNVVEENLEGNGLGLYIVKSIMEQTGGDVWFESEQDKGTTFYVSLPLTGMRKKEGTKTLI